MVFPVPGGPYSSTEAGGAALDEPAQRGAGPQQVALADDLVERPGAHADGQRRGRGAARAGRVGDPGGYRVVELEQAVGVHQPKACHGT